MRQVLIGLERNLQCGGTLLLFPSPYEDTNEAEWRRMGEVCQEFVKYMTSPERAFEAVVRDHYSDVLHASPYTHPATCLGTEPRFKRSPFVDRQVLLFLEKLRLTANDIVKLPEFRYASSEEKERRRQEKILKAKRRCDERKPNFFVIQDPDRQRHKKAITFDDARAADKRGPHHDRDDSRRVHRHPSPPSKKHTDDDRCRKSTTYNDARAADRRRSHHDHDEMRHDHRRQSAPSRNHSDNDRNWKDRGSSREDRATSSGRLSSHRRHVKE